MSLTSFGPGFSGLPDVAGGHLHLLVTVERAPTYLMCSMLIRLPRRDTYNELCPAAIYLLYLIFS